MISRRQGGRRSVASPKKTTHDFGTRNNSSCAPVEPPASVRAEVQALLRLVQSGEAGAMWDTFWPVRLFCRLPQVNFTPHHQQNINVEPGWIATDVSKQKREIQRATFQPSPVQVTFGHILHMKLILSNSLVG